MDTNLSVKVSPSAVREVKHLNNNVLYGKLPRGKDKKERVVTDKFLIVNGVEIF